MPSHPSDQRTLIRDLVVEIEALRVSRRLKWRDRQHPENKNWSQEELRDLAYPSYNHLLRGSTQRLPSRAYVLRIADYLECNNHETNDLLLAAEYLPQVLEPRDDEQRAALEQARQLMHSIPLPALLLTRGWHIEAYNALSLATHGMVSATPELFRPLLEIACDPTLPVRQHWTPDERMWQANITSCVTAFKQVHAPFRRETWYQEMTQQACRRWPEIATWDHPADGSAEFENRMLDKTTGMVIHDRSFVVTFGAALFPQLVVSVPVDAPAHHAYQQFGCSITENRWEHALRLGGSYA